MIENCKEEQYVLGLLVEMGYTREHGPSHKLALIRKRLPGGSTTVWNGFGGRIAPGETPPDALARLCNAVTDLPTTSEFWDNEGVFATVREPRKYIVHCFFRPLCWERPVMIPGYDLRWVVMADMFKESSDTLAMHIPVLFMAALTAAGHERFKTLRMELGVPAPSEYPDTTRDDPSIQQAIADGADEEYVQAMLLEDNGPPYVEEYESRHILPGSELPTRSD